MNRYRTLLGLLAANGFFVSIGISDPSTVHGMTALAGASALLMFGSPDLRRNSA
jgi:hypothetical protein